MLVTLNPAPINILGQQLLQLCCNCAPGNTIQVVLARVSSPYNIFKEFFFESQHFIIQDGISRMIEIGLQ